LKGLKGRPNIKTSGMEKGATPRKPQQQGKQPGRGKVTPRVKVEEEVIRIEIHRDQFSKVMSLSGAGFW